MERHELSTEFPEHKEVIHHLKMENAHFKKLYEKYHELEKEIYHINTGIEVVDDNQMHVLKARLLHIKDEIFTIVSSH